MSKGLTIWILAVFLVGVVSPTVAAGPKKIKPLSDGFILAGLDGEVVGSNKPPSKTAWYESGWSFEFDSEVVEGKNKISADKAVVLLPLQSVISIY